MFGTSLQSDGLERMRMIGMNAGFSKSKFIDPHSYVTIKVKILFL